jgi:dolichol-phosphate mannosyltransferase
MKLISIITPVFNEDDCINDFFDEIIKIKNNLNNYSLELIFTNNASTDGTKNKIKDICNKHDWVKLYSLTRNFGYQNSLLCGLEKAKGDYIMMVDVDLEDPPLLIFDFIDAINRGYKIAYGIRNNREGNYIMNLLRLTWYKFFNLISEHRAILYMSEFCMISNDIRNMIVNIKSSHVYIRNEIAYAGYAALGINYRRLYRKKGNAKGASILYIILFAITGLISSTTFPLRLSSYFGIVLLLLFSILSLLELNLNIIKVLLVIYILYFLIVISAYVSRIHKDIINKEKYIINPQDSFNIE